MLVAGEETEGRFALVETVEARGSEMPGHLHHREGEALCVLDGVVDVWVAGRRREASAGAVVFVPRLVEHALVVKTGTARVLSLFVPAGFEGFYRAPSQPAPAATLPPAPDGPPDISQLLATAAAHGVEILGPPPADGTQ